MRLWSIFKGSFHSAATYREVRRSESFFLGYAFLVAVLCALIATSYFFVLIQREVFTARNGKPILFDDVMTQIASQLPVMTLKDKKLVSNDPEPTIIRVSGEAFGIEFDNIEVITIDTSGESTLANMKTPILITDQEVIIKTEEDTEIHSIAELAKTAPTTMVINRAMADDVANQLIDSMHRNLPLLYFAIFISLTASIYFMRIFMLLALGVVGLAISSITRNPISFTSAVGLAAVSYTPVALLDTILFAVLFYPASMGVLFAAGSVALFAAMSCSKERASPSTAA